jgi:glycosyltransferase involved in cell wall biosynthesis
MKILHIISGLTNGGAERMLHKLVVELARETHGGHVSVVVCLGPVGGTAGMLEAAGVEVHYFRLRKGPSALSGLWKLALLTRRLRPDAIQGWLSGGNLAAVAAGTFVAAPVYWSIHQSLYTLGYETPVNRALIRACAALSRLPQGIVHVSGTGARQHARFGFSDARATVIPIGFDLETYRPLSPEHKRAARARLGLEASRVWVGWVARDDAKKDPGNFIAAARATHALFPDARFLMLGRGLEAPDSPCRALARDAGLEDVVHFRGETNDPAAWIATLDVLVSSSYTEGFPNVIGEAMACEVPCAVTDVGDSGWLVGETGRVAPPRDAVALSRALVELLRLAPEARNALGQAARARIRERFSIASVADRYLELYDRGSGNP